MSARSRERVRVSVSRGLLELLADYVYWREVRLAAEGRDWATREWARASESQARAQVASQLAGELEAHVRSLVDARVKGPGQDADESRRGTRNREM